MMPEQTLAAAAAHGRSGFDPLALLKARWPVLGAAGALGMVATIAFYLFSPKWYSAEILIVPKQTSMGGLAAAGSMLGQLPLDVGGSSGLMSSDAERISAILMSRSTGDAVIERFDLIRRYDVDKIEHARDMLRSLCATKVERKANMVLLTCEDTEPAVARDMAEYFGKVGDEGFRRIATSLAGEERKFLEARVAEARGALDKASKALRVFQENSKIIDLPEQSKAVVSAMAALEGELISKRIQLSYLSGFVSKSESSATQVGRQIEALSSELKALQEQRPASESLPGRGAGSDLFPPASEVPGLRYQLEGLYRELKVRETVFLLLTERFESLRLDEARDLSTFVVFDHAALPTHRIRPRGRVMPMGLLAGVAIGAILILLPAWWRDRLGRRSA
jgi:capsule polysaccharide export protein KpsE/RkpR